MQPGQTSTTGPVSSERTVKRIQTSAAGKPLDAHPKVETVIQLNLYRLTIPFGTVSQNEDFWRSIDEDCIDVATRDLLLKNGLRVGRAATAQWEIISKLIAEYPATTHKSGLVAAEASSMDLMMKQGEGSEHIFYYDSRNELIGRTYERWENYMSLAFQSAPRKPKHVRVALCPAVRSERKRFEYNLRNEEQPEIQYVAPERLYDMNLRADLPPETFLIIAPSSEGKWPTSIGSSFLVSDAPAERMEQVLLIVPKPFTVDPAKVGTPEASASIHGK